MKCQVWLLWRNKSHFVALCTEKYYHGMKRGELKGADGKSMDENRQKKLPIGIESFEEIRAEGFCYIDKTVLIMELLDNWGKVNLFTRPMLCSIVGAEAMRFQFLLESSRLTDREKKQYEQLIMVDETNQESFRMPDSVLMGSLKTLSRLLQKHYGKKVLLLIGEYDVPLAKANEKGYYEQMVSLVRNVFEQALKKNESLYFAVMAGCLRVDKGLTKREIEKLIAGEAVEKEIRQELTYNSLYDSAENLWSTLFATGYLTQRGRQGREVERLFTAYLQKTISVRDTFVKRETKENFYHGILLGILGYKEGWYVSSNKEAGNGYSDIQIEIEDEKIGIVIEVKYAHEEDKDGVCRKALEQIERLGYAKRLYEDGMKTVLKYGIACYRKECRVMAAMP